MDRLTQDRFNYLSLIFFFHTYIGFSKQGHATILFMQMVPPSLGFSRSPKLIQPLLIGHDRRLTHGCPASVITSPIERLPGRGRVDLFHTSVQTVVFHEGDGIIPMGCFFDPSSQGRLRLVSGTPQRTMEPLKIGTGFLSWEKATTAQNDFVVILSRATQLHLGGKLAFVLQQPSLQIGSHLGMDVFFQFLRHDVTGVLKQIHRTPLLGALVP